MSSSKIIWNILPKDDKYGLYYNTYHLALKNIAEKYSIEYQFPGMNTLDELLNFNFKLPDNDSPIIFIAHHDRFDKRCSDKILIKCPKAKIIVCGSDTVYYGAENVTRLHVDVFIETMKSQVEILNKIVPTEHIYWTISEDIIKYLENDKRLIEKKYDGICLCNGTIERMNFFSNMNNRGKKTLFNLKLTDFNIIFDYYKESKFIIGTSSCSPGFANQKTRTMKGMRDWIGQFCGTPLIYDDYEDIVDIGEDVIPTYKFLDADSCIKLMDSLNSNPTKYNEILENQKKWLKENTMENQLEIILTKHKILGKQ